MSDGASIAVVGVGAIGGAMAAALGDAGHNPALCVRTPFQYLSRHFDGETREYAHRVYTRPGDVSHMDWVLLCTKAHQIDGAAHWLRRLIGPDSRVGVMQNGVDHAARVSAYAEAERVVPCIIFLPARSDEPGFVEQAGAGSVQVPESRAGRALADLFAGQSAVKVAPTAETNAVGGAICALALEPLSAVAATHVRGLAIGLIEEIMRVGRAEGASFPEDFAEKTIEKFRGPIGEHWTSIAADRRDGRPMEWEARNAVVGQIGRRHGIQTPLNDALTALLALIDAPSK